MNKKENLKGLAEGIDYIAHDQVTNELDTILDGTKWEETESENLIKEGLSGKAVGFGKEQADMIFNDTENFLSGTENEEDAEGIQGILNSMSKQRI